jgi:hypothetical protein
MSTHACAKLRWVLLWWLAKLRARKSPCRKSCPEARLLLLLLLLLLVVIALLCKPHSRCGTVLNIACIPEHECMTKVSTSAHVPAVAAAQKVQLVC